MAVRESLDLSSYDPLARSAQHDPYPWYRAFHDADVAVHRSPTPSLAGSLEGNHFRARPTEEIWSVLSYKEVQRALQTTSVFCSGGGPGPAWAAPINGVGALVWADAPAHMVQRKLAAKAFTPRRVAALEAWIRSLANGFMDPFVGRGHADYQQEFADKLPGTVACALLGITAEHQHRYHAWTIAWTDSLDGDVAAQEREMAASLDFFQFFTELIGSRREALQRGQSVPDDLLSILITAEEDGERFNDLTLMLILQVLIVGAEDTTSGTLGSGVDLLCRHPEQLAMLRRDRTLIPNAIEEILRHQSPVQSLFRNTSTAVTVGGVEIPPDAKIRVCLGAANRDPEVFPDPDRFDITRDGAQLRRTFAFGSGVHACLGASLARMMLRNAFEITLDRLTDIHLSATEPQARGDNLIMRRFKHVPIEWTP